MADRPTASVSRVGRPRTRSAHQTPHVPKVGGPRSKSVYQSKVEDSAKKTPESQEIYHRPNTIKRMVLSEYFCHNDDETKSIVSECDCINQNVIKVKTMTIVNYRYV